jgi:glycosyltransferase involved in cell wall biosynthesis
MLVPDQTDVRSAVDGEGVSQRGDRPWHVVAVVENVPLGQDHRLRKQVDALLGAGFEVSVVTMRDDANRPYRDRAGLRLLEHRAPPEPSGPGGYVVEYAWSFLCAAVALARLRRRGRIDVLQLCQPPDVYFPLAWLARCAGARVVVDQRDLMPELLAARYPQAPRPFMFVLRMLERWTQRAADRTITVNEVLRDRLSAVADRSHDVTVVWNGPVLSRVDTAQPDPALREAGTRLVVWAGKMGLQDGVILLPDLVDGVVHGLDRPDVRFAVLGDGECLEDLRAQVAERGLEPWVTITGWVAEETVFAYLASADAGLDISEQAEVTPVKALEYMAFGLPFVCFDIAETRRLASGAAVLVEAGDVAGLGRALVELVDSPDRRVLGEVGRRAVEKTLAWERQVPAYLAAVGPPRDR